MDDSGIENNVGSYAVNRLGSEFGAEVERFAGQDEFRWRAAVNRLGSKFGAEVARFADEEKRARILGLTVIHEGSIAVGRVGFGVDEVGFFKPQVEGAGGAGIGEFESGVLAGSDDLDVHVAARIFGDPIGIRVQEGTVFVEKVVVIFA